MKDKEKKNISMKEMITKRSFEPITNCNCKVESRIDYAVRKSENKEGAFAELLNQEIEELQKAKQIEELTSIIDSFNIRTYANAQAVAKFLIEKYGYRKLPEDSVVLSREEYEELQVGKDFDYGYHEGYKNTEAYYENFKLPEIRKETAEKILNKVNEFFRPFDKKSPIFLDLLLTKLENIVKQCCVETKE